MKRQETITIVALLAASVMFASGCSKREPAASATAAEPAAVATTASAPEPAPGLQPTPGLPVATFTPKSDVPAPMLPTLGSAPAPIDEHSQSPDKAAVRRIAPEEAAMLVSTGDAILVDVRGKEYFDQGHVKGAINMPFAEIEGRARAELPPTRWIIPYCT